MGYSALQIKNEYLGMLGGSFTPSTTLTGNLDKVVAESFVEMLLLFGPTKSNATAFNLLWRYWAQSRMALLSDGPGSARALRLRADFDAFKQMTESQKNEDRYLKSNVFLFPPWMAGLVKAVGDIVVPTADVDDQPVTLAYQCTTAGTTSTTTEPSWAAPYVGTGTGVAAGSYVAAGNYNGQTLYARNGLVSGAQWYLWYNGSVWVVSTVVGTNGALYWTSATSTITSAYTVNTGVTTLAIAAGSATVTDGSTLVWTAIAFPTG